MQPLKVPESIVYKPISMSKLLEVRAADDVLEELAKLVWREQRHSDEAWIPTAPALHARITSRHVHHQQVDLDFVLDDVLVERLHANWLAMQEDNHPVLGIPDPHPLVSTMKIWIEGCPL